MRLVVEASFAKVSQSVRGVLCLTASCIPNANWMPDAISEVDRTRVQPSNLLLGVCATELPLFAQWLCRSLVLCSLAPNHSYHPVLLIYWCRNVWRISSSDSVAELMRALKLNTLKGFLLWITGETRLEAAYRLSLSEPWSGWFFEERKDPTR